jgi:hypothetical protein
MSASYGGMFPLIYMAAWMIQLHVFSGKLEDVDFLLSKAKSLALGSCPGITAPCMMGMQTAAGLP